MTLCNETKSIPISKAMVWQAYKRVRANKGSAGVDQISMEQFDADLSTNYTNFGIVWHQEAIFHLRSKK